MANRHRGEIDAVLDGKSWTLCLTLGALAELEGKFEVDNIGDLINRFSSGKFSAGQLLAIISLGLKGGGHTITEMDVAQMRADGGATGFVEIAAKLLTATFEPSRGSGKSELTRRKDRLPNPR